MPFGAGSPARILRCRLPRNEVDRLYLYVTDPIAEPPVPAGSFAVNGLVELLPLNSQYLVSMERSFSVGAPGTGNTIRLYLVKLAGADNIDGVDSIASDLDDIRPVRKTLLADLDELGIPLDTSKGWRSDPSSPTAAARSYWRCFLEVSNVRPQDAHCSSHIDSVRDDPRRIIPVVDVDDVSRGDVLAGIAHEAAALVQLDGRRHERRGVQSNDVGPAARARSTRAVMSARPAPPARHAGVTELNTDITTSFR